MVWKVFNEKEYNDCFWEHSGDGEKRLSDELRKKLCKGIPCVGYNFMDLGM